MGLTVFSKTVNVAPSRKRNRGCHKTQLTSLRSPTFFFSTSHLRTVCRFGVCGGWYSWCKPHSFPAAGRAHKYHTVSASSAHLTLGVGVHSTLKPRPWVARYHHLALREVIKAWQVRLDCQGHLKLTHDVARGGGIGAGAEPQSSFLPAKATNKSFFLTQSKSTELKASSSRPWVGHLFSTPSPPLQSDRTQLGATLPCRGPGSGGGHQRQSPEKGSSWLGGLFTSPTLTQA